MDLSYEKKPLKKLNLKQEVDQLKEENKELLELIESYKSILYGNLEKHNINSYGFHIYDSYIFPSYFKSVTKWFITLSHDPKFLSFNRINQAVNYYLQILSETIETLDDKDNIQIFGCFELNKSGNVHCHFIYEAYNAPYMMLDSIKPKLTHRTYLNVAVDMKQITDSYKNQSTGNVGLQGSVDYLIKSPLKLFGKINKNI